MSYASVDIEALDSLVRTVKDASESIEDDHTTITDALEGGPVSVSGLARAPEIAAWLGDQHPTLSNQLGYARWLDASTPGVQSTVTFDESMVPALTEDQAKELAEQARALMVPGEPPSAELLDLLRTYGGNPQFALFLMDGYREGEGAATTDVGPTIDDGYLNRLPTGPAGEQFLQLYSQTLAGLTYEFPPDEMSASADGNPDPYRVRALLASRGDWSPQWLSQLGNDMIAAERADPEIWTKTLWGGDADGAYENISTIRDPQGLDVEDPMVWLMDALSRNPVAAQDLFGGGGDAPVVVDGEEVPISANLRWLSLERSWNQDQGLSLGLALGTASSLDDPGFAHDFDALSNIDPAKKQSWWSFGAHLGLDIVGLVPVIGELADGANVSLSLAEGDYVGAGASAAAAVPLFGSTATITKWMVKLANRSGDVVGAALTARNLRTLLQELDRTDQAPAAVHRPLTDPTYLASSGDRPWFEQLGRPGRNEAYVVPGGVVLRTDGQGRITGVEGDAGALTPAEQAWIRDHSADG